MPSPNLMAAALARRTRSCALVVLGAPAALYNPPTRVAEEYAMLDVLSGGRLIAGFPVGTVTDAAYAYGQVPTSLAEKHAEAHDLILQSWLRPEPFAFNGKYTQLRYVNIWPRPLQQPNPPIWVPGDDGSKIWQWAAEREYAYCYLGQAGTRAAARTFDGYWQTVDRLGLDQNPYRAALLQLVAVAETDALAERDYSAPLEYWHRWHRRRPADWGSSLDPRFDPAPRADGQFRGDPSRRADDRASVWAELVERGAVVAGSAATVRDRLLDLACSLRVGHLVLSFHFGNMARELAVQNTELFARAVMPSLRTLWSDWEDRWSPGDVVTTESSGPAAAPAGAAGVDPVKPEAGAL